MAPEKSQTFRTDHSIRPMLRARSRVSGFAREMPARPLPRRREAETFGEVAMGYRVAVVGATGNVGREMLNILAERAFPADEVIALASRRSQGTEVSFGDKTLKVKALEHHD